MGDVTPDSSPSCDWSQLPPDLLVSVLSVVQLPDLFASAAVCRTWRAACSTVRRHGLLSPNQEPYLVYSADQDPGTATLHNLYTGKIYHAVLPDPPFRSRYVVGSSHGWLVTADERSNLHLVNPATGAQVTLPPPESMIGVRPSFTADGLLRGHYIHDLDVRHRCINDRVARKFFPPEETRHFLYQKVILTSDPSGGDSTVMLRHGLWDYLSFARIEDIKWTWLAATERCERYDDFFYDGDDGLFYAIPDDGELHTIDLNCPSPMVKVILNDSPRIDCCTHYILRAPWGDLLQVWRLYGDPPSDTDDDECLSHCLSDYPKLEDIFWVNMSSKKPIPEAN